MKDHRFIELVNLYVDRQITAAETAELEAEIQTNPRRRAIYRQYCQMNHATSLVYESFRAASPASAAVESAGRGSIAQFQNRRRVRLHRWAYSAGGLAAAACLALVFARLNSTPAPDADARLQPAAVTAVTASQPAVAPVAVAAVPVHLVVGPASLRNVAEPDYAALLVALRQAELRNRQIASVPPTSLFQDGVFDSPVGAPAASQRTFRSRQSPAQQAEFTAFQFQR